MPQDVHETVSGTASGTIYLILIQVASRALTFIGNQVLLQFLSPKLLGIAVQLELFSVFVLYFSRESLRVALQRQPEQADKEKRDDGQANETKSVQSQSIVNLSYLVVFSGSCLTLGFGYSWYNRADVVVLESPYFGISLLLYGVATIIELLSEPSFVIIQQNLFYKARAQAETRAAILKCLAACSTAFLCQRLGWEPSALPFAVGQCTYAISLFVFYLKSAYPTSTKEKFSMLLRSVENNPSYIFSYFSKPLLNLAGTLYAQSIFKQLLTQGDALILSFLASLSDQGAFAFASNYGSLIARLIFQPIEESSRSAFGKLLATNPSNGKPDKRGLQAVIDHLSGILHLYGLIALLSCAYLSTILPLVVRTIAGPGWCTPVISALLSTYSYSIPFLAYNGILDAFVTSVATPAELAQQSFWVAGFTAAYLGSAYVLLCVMDLGAEGLVIGNMVNMALRIGWSVVFIQRYFRRQGVQVDTTNMRPQSSTIASCVGTAAVLWAYTPDNGFMLQDGLASLVPLVVICAVGGLSM
jgi:oligosaccharide translocation protein RFT1